MLRRHWLLLLFSVATQQAAASTILAHLIALRNGTRCGVTQPKLNSQPALIQMSRTGWRDIPWTGFQLKVAT
jgi:hypothetical protein